MRGCGHKSSPEKEEVDVEIPMQRMSQSSQKQPRRHLVCYMWKLVTREMPQHVSDQYCLDQPDIEWTCPACALPQLTDSFFEDVPEGDTLILAEDYLGETTQNTVLEQSLHRDVTETPIMMGWNSSGNSELFRKHHNSLEH